MDNSAYIASVRQMARETERATRQVEKNYGTTATASLGSMRRIQQGLVGLGIGKVVTDSVRLEAQYSKTMALVQAQTGASAAKLRELDQLALQLGKDTQFSANEAAQAMLELTKGGLTPAEVQAGALHQTLQLATAGQIDLATAANSVVGVMGAFELGAKDTDAAVAALAGSANASSADVTDMVQALAQVGPSANAAGLSVQETTALLAAFAQAGLKGSDAGTSLKTFLQNLTPTTDRQAEAMRELNLEFVDQNGNYVSAIAMAGRLKQATKGLSDSERSRYLTAIFGSDAQRAANILANAGAKEVANRQKETSDLTQTQKLSDAAMKGTGGALEELRGSAETAQLQLGRGLAPTIQELADQAGELIDSGDFERWGRNLGEGIESAIATAQPFAEAVLPLLNTGLQALGDVLETVGPLAKDLAGAFGALPDDVQKAALLAGGAAFLTRRLRGATGGMAGAGGVFGGASLTNPVPVFVVNPGAAGLPGGAPLPDGPGSGRPQKPGGGFKVPPIVAGTGRWLTGAGTLVIGSMTLNETISAQDSLGRSKSANDPLNGRSVAEILKKLEDSNLGKYAAELGINLEKLANDLAFYGSEGGYAKAAEKKLTDGEFSVGGLTKAVTGTILPFYTSNAEKLTRAENDFYDIISSVDAELKRARKDGGYDPDLAKLFGINLPKIQTPRKPPLPAFLTGVQGFEVETNAANAALMEAIFGRPSTQNGVQGGLSGFDFGKDKKRGSILLGAGIKLDTSDVDQKSPVLRRRLDDLTQDRTIRIRLAFLGTAAASGAAAGAVTPSAGSGGSDERVADALSRIFRGYGDGTTSYGAGVWSSSASQAGIDYDRLASAVGRAQQPLIGQMVMQPHNYSEFERQMDQVRTSRAASGE